jgi:hypothetical protein
VTPSWCCHPLQVLQPCGPSARGALA